MSEPYILIVDDDEAVLDTLARMLQSAGHRVETAGNGGEALARIRAGLPALLITDLLLRGEHGLDLARVVKNLPGWSLGPGPTLVADWAHLGLVVLLGIAALALRLVGGQK